MSDFIALDNILSATSGLLDYKTRLQDYLRVLLNLA